MPGCRYVQDYNEKDPRTHKGHDLRRMPMAALYQYFGLDAQTVDFIGHAIALHRFASASPLLKLMHRRGCLALPILRAAGRACRDDAYLREPALETVRKIQLYNDSLHRFEGTKSPYIYPLYGLGELPQASLPRACKPGRGRAILRTSRGARRFALSAFDRERSASALGHSDRPLSAHAGVRAAERGVRRHVHAEQAGRKGRV